MESAHIAKLFAILEATSGKPQGKSLAELAAEVGLAKSTAHRLLQSLCSLGYMANDGSDIYKQTPLFRQFASGFGDQRLIRSAQPHMMDLQREAGETVNLGEERPEVRVEDKTEVTLEMARLELSVPLLCDVLDALGYRNQSPRISLSHLTGPRDNSSRMLVGYAKTTLWADMAHVDPVPYVLELAAVDSCRPDDIIVCAAGGSMRSGIWGELLSTAARNRGVAGVIVDGAVRDVAKMRSMGFPVYGLGTSPYDSRDRQRVIDVDVTVEIQGVAIESGDLVAVDEDGMVVVPRLVISQILSAAWKKARDENQVRDAIQNGMTATAAFQKFGVL